MENFTPVSALIGGALIGLAASLFFLLHGKIAGVASLFGNLVDRGTGAGRSAAAAGGEDRSVPLYFVAGLLLAGVLARLAYPSALPASTPSLALGGAAGLLVGLGTRLSSGCTSGHGVCGLSRLSKRSLVATLTFMATGMLTAAALHALRGAS